MMSNVGAHTHARVDHPLDGSLLRSIAPAGYLIAVALLGPFLSPLVGSFTGVVPIGSLAWRFGAFGLFFGSHFYLVLALLVAACAAAALGHRNALFTIALFSLVACIMMLAALPIFSLDTLQMRRALKPDAFQPYRVGALKAAAQAGLGVAILFILFRGSLRAARALPHTRESGRR
jgi:hypothetical protein